MTYLRSLGAVQVENDVMPAVGKSLVELQLPKTTLIVLVNKGGKFITPNGATVLEAGDVLFVMTDHDEELEKVNQVWGQCKTPMR